MFLEMIFLHLSNVVFIIAVLVLFLRFKNKVLLVMLVSMLVTQAVYWVPLMIDLPVWDPTSSERVMAKADLINELLQYTQLGSEIITSVAFLIFALSFSGGVKATKKAKTSSK